jgi:DNA-binding NarL/FixJ family response regulator
MRRAAARTRPTRVVWHDGVMPVRVLVVDDNPLFRDGIASLLSRQRDIAVVGAVGSGEEAVALAPALVPQLVLLDVAMPGSNSVEATRRLLAQQPDLAICLLTVSEQDPAVLAALRAGAHGCLVKSLPLGELTAAIIRLAEGGVAMSQ